MDTWLRALVLLLVLQQSRCNTADDDEDICGDGKRAGTEGCDDGALVAGDGCSQTCTVECGFVCFGDGGSTPDMCSPVCGDGTKANQHATL
jgi:cysteine-rich repeat protein